MKLDKKARYEALLALLMLSLLLSGVLYFLAVSVSVYTGYSQAVEILGDPHPELVIATVALSIEATALPLVSYSMQFGWWVFQFGVLVYVISLINLFTPD